MEKKGSQFQGGIVQLPDVKSQSGVMRARVNPGDGQLYMVGLQGWGTTAATDGSFERLRYAGGDINLPEELHVTQEGAEIRFTNPLDLASAQNIKNYDVQRWKYLYSEEYGSPEMSLAHPLQKGRDTLAVSSATIGEDARTVLLEIPDIQSVMQMEITYNLKFKNGQKATNTIYHTINWLSETDTDNQPPWQQRIISGIRDSLMEAENTHPVANLISENECRTCHTVKEGSVGPSFMEISQRYEKNKAMIEQLSQKIIKGGSGNWGQRAMPPHPNITKEDAEEMTEYILSTRG